MASFYAVHHGPDGLEAIARRLLVLRQGLVLGLAALGLAADPGPGFDTVVVRTAAAPSLRQRAVAAGFNLRCGIRGDDGEAALAISLDELSTPE